MDIKGVLFQPWKDVNIHHFSSLLDKMADSMLRLVRSPVSQTPCGGSIGNSVVMYEAQNKLEVNIRPNELLKPVWGNVSP